MSCRQLCRFLRRDLVDVLAPVFRASVHCEAGEQLFVMNLDPTRPAPSSTRTLMLVTRTFLSSRKMILVSPTAWGVRMTVRSSCAVASTIFGFPINMVLNGLSVVNVDIKLGLRGTVFAASSARVAHVVAATKIAATNIPAHCGPSLATTSRRLRQTRHSRAIGPCLNHLVNEQRRRRTQNSQTMWPIRHSWASLHPTSNAGHGANARHRPGQGLPGKLWNESRMNKGRIGLDRRPHVPRPRGLPRHHT